MDKVPVDWLRYVWIIPIVVGFVTFVLTSLFTVYRERKNNNIPRRILMEYAEYELRYPFDKDAPQGEGKILVGKNGKKLIDHAKNNGGSVYTFMILKNITENDAINVKINFVFSNRSRKEEIRPKDAVSEEFFLPVWKNTDTLYIPSTMYNGTTHFSTSEELVISYTTTGFEHFKYSYIRQYNGQYFEKLEKRYLGFIWLPKVIYHRSDFYTFINVKKKSEETKNEKAEKKES